ncbi:MAG: hypothetical protein IKL36_03010 [Clostridia bacterium]|nr:hypothetical protein [Clostridia bacterium]
MNCLETAKERLGLLIKNQVQLLLTIKEDYDLDDEDCEDAESVQSAINCGDITLEWDENRDVDYADDAVRCQQMLVRALELIEAGDKKSIHNANKALETLIREARKVRKDKEEDVKKAQELVSLMDEIISVCDNHRQKR